MNVGVLASHEGTTLQSLLDAFAGGRIPGRVSVVVSNNGDAGALLRAREAGVQAVHLSSRTHRDPATLDTATMSEGADQQGRVLGECLLADYVKSKEREGPGAPFCAGAQHNQSDSPGTRPWICRMNSMVLMDACRPFRPLARAVRVVELSCLPPRRPGDTSGQRPVSR
jgi:hypothetical protein